MNFFLTESLNESPAIPYIPRCPNPLIIEIDEIVFTICFESLPKPVEDKCVRKSDVSVNIGSFEFSNSF